MSTVNVTTTSRSFNISKTNRLEMTGTLDLQQFWPDGSSDADTTKLLLSVNPGSTRIHLAGKTQFQATSAYDEAVYVTGKDKKNGLLQTKPLVKKNIIKIRLQRIDAPELHYRPDTRGSEGALQKTVWLKNIGKTRLKQRWSNWLSI